MTDYPEAITGADLRKQAAQLSRAARALSVAADKVLDAANLLDKPIGSKQDRLEQLRAWLTENGPMRRVDIVNNCPIPRGTISVILKESNGFMKVDDLWTTKEDDCE